MTVSRSVKHCLFGFHRPESKLVDKKNQQSSHKAIIIQNHPLVGLGLLKDVLLEKGFTIETYNSQQDDIEHIKDDDADLMVVLGGTAGVYEYEKYPWLLKVEKLIKSRIDADLPLIGSCLGGQLIAHVLGAKVYKSDKQKEVGYIPLQLTEAGKHHLISCFAGNDGMYVPESHGDVFDLPPDVELLASTEKNHNQVFSKGKTLAFQFHPEATADSFQRWVQLWLAQAKETGTDFDSITPRLQMVAHASKFEEKAKIFFGQWIDSIVCKKDHGLTEMRINR